MLDQVPHQVLQQLLEIQALLVFKVLEDHKVPKVQVEHLVLWEIKDHKVQLVNKEI